MAGQRWAGIFDWDGVVVDSARQHEESWQRLAIEEGRVLPPGHFRRGFGMKNEFIIPELLGWTRDSQEISRLSLRKETLYREALRETGIQLLPGVEELLRSFGAAGIPCAVGSSTPRLNITCVLEQLGLQTAFSVIVSAEDVRHGKPDPAIFLAAAQALEVPPARCLVFEDTTVGIQAAHAAGMRVVAVTTTHPCQALHDADRVVCRLDELSLGELQQLVLAEAHVAPRAAREGSERCSTN